MSEAEKHSLSLAPVCIKLNLCERMTSSIIAHWESTQRLKPQCVIFNASWPVWKPCDTWVEDTVFRLIFGMCSNIHWQGGAIDEARIRVFGARSPG
jgi:hypothetical protein